MLLPLVPHGCWSSLGGTSGNIWVGTSELTFLHPRPPVVAVLGYQGTFICIRYCFFSFLVF